MSASSLIAQGFGGYAGWPDREADANFAETGGAGKRTSGGGGGGGSSVNIQELIQKTVDEVINGAIGRQIEQFKTRAKEFDEKNPFAFDEALAAKSATEQFEPYYKKTLNDYLQGIETQRRRGTEDEKTLLTDLKADVDSYTGRSKQMLSRAINASEQGFADAGTFFSGEKARGTGILEIDQQQQLGEYLRGAGSREQNIKTTTGRLLEDLQREQRLKTEAIGTEQQFQVKSEVERSRQATEKKRALEREQYLGTPLSTGFGTLNIPSSIYGG